MPFLVYQSVTKPDPLTSGLVYQGTIRVKNSDTNTPTSIYLLYDQGNITGNGDTYSLTAYPLATVVTALNQELLSRGLNPSLYTKNFYLDLPLSAADIALL